MDVSHPKLHLYSLPNEVLVQILSSFSTRSLIPWARVSYRFHALILRILHYRLLVGAPLQEYKLILECFHPSSKLIEPHVFCTYLGTDDLNSYEGNGSLYENTDTAQQLGRLSSVYSRFRPEVTVEERSNGTRLVPVTDDGQDPHRDDLVVTRPINLEEFEEFFQLCVLVNIVKVMPGTNLLLSAHTVEDGVIRVFRDWLRDEEKRFREFIPEGAGHSQMLWVDQSKSVGIKVRVRGKKFLNQHIPLLVHRDDEQFTSYELDIEELHIRSVRLLLTLEKSQEEQQNYYKAVVLTPNIR
ncbi:F-box domain protein [Aspergillus sclerotioniger CBS 115572]|uniref:F-box domain protein n=1 Tax=Aspergillus sclerotioniger CBS 115572 TaxID=1450535 RepID=A0A317WHM7_9EURO|nr:F-box domain protein [Aspergillus sclerotioniger CBS 115572]XP_025466662.1 F-box domain protein [Aspergillus sclerotioniger CBS 115572]PWY66033.1 F-box domain protein [Aspergillus sclerotioniger CBS 115572]PWY84737.1 F-box domain protein [Aspergillus sclerotioniger CBS 115572]